MNIRIKELAEQAGEYVNEVYTPPVRSKTPGKIWEDGHVGWHTQFNQKFAELVVKDCASQIDAFVAMNVPPVLLSSLLRKQYIKDEPSQEL